MAEVRKTGDWLDDLELLLQMLPAQYKISSERPQEAVRLKALYLSCEFGVTGVYAAGEIQGSIALEGEAFWLFVRQDPAGLFSRKISPAGCTCEHSQGKYPCQHVSLFCRYLIRQLRNQESDLVDRLQSDEVIDTPPPFIFDNKDDFVLRLSLLDSHLTAIQKALVHSEVDDPGLPDPEDLLQKRIVWNLVVSNGAPVMQPLIQQPTKRGGYSKGRKVTLENLHAELENHPEAYDLSPQDQVVVGLIRLSPEHSYSFSPRLSLEPAVAIGQLVGAENVLLNEQPVVIETADYEVSIGCLSGDLWGFELKLSSSLGEPVTFNSLTPRDVGQVRIIGEYLLWVGSDAGRICICQDRVERLEMLWELVKFAGIAKIHLNALLARARNLRTTLPITLPPELEGPLELLETVPVMLLRTRADGQLDFGFRVRCPDGRLRLPGGAPLIMTTERDGQTVQVQRDGLVEKQRAIGLAGHLEIKVENHQNWSGTIADFQAGLEFLERLRELAEQVELLWDPQSASEPSVLGSLSNKNVSVQITSERNWFGVCGTAQVGDQSIQLEQLVQAVGSDDLQTVQGNFVHLGKGNWTRVSSQLKERLQRLRDATHTERNKLRLDATAAPLVRDLMDEELQVDASQRWHECLARLRQAESLDPQVPTNLQAELRDYQLEGFRWMRRLAEWGVGGILADDMGLGKTLQALAVLLDRAAAGPALVIAPTSVGFNWVREAERFAPDLNVSLYRETERLQFLETVAANNLVICSYGLALRDGEALAKVNWTSLVLDEAQAIKNSRSKTSQAIQQIPADWVLGLTGTPVENHLGELWSLFRVVSPGVFGSWDSFRGRFAAPIERDQSESARIALADRLKPFVLRRTKTEVLTELPPRTEMNLYVDLSKEEQARYEQVRLAALGEVETIADLSNPQEQRIRILAMLTRLRQLACHVGLVDPSWDKSSAKLDQLCLTLEDLRAEGHRALVFSQFTKHLALIRQALDERGITYAYLDGSTPAQERQQRVDAFQEGDANVFLISLKAGGTGLNLTAADYVIHMDPWWNPAVEDQATDRAHRMGQERPVMVYRIVARGTVEEEILSLHEAKRDLVAGVMAGTQAAGKMDNQQLISLLKKQP
ncbi:DEAD/DEAH box helicase [Planctomycetaceae bacterium SH139]